MHKETPMSRLLATVTLVLIATALIAPIATGDKEDERIPNRPKVPGKLRLKLQERRETAPKSGEFKVVEKMVDWNVAETAIIVCDMWDDHHCRSAAHRVGIMAPKMNAVLTAARDHGVQIIHAPSETMYIYADYPQRKRMQQAKVAKPPVPIARWCNLDTTK